MQLIDQIPSEPLIMLTLMVDAEKVTNATGQKITAYCRSAALVLFLISCGLTRTVGCSLSLG